MKCENHSAKEDQTYLLLCAMILLLHGLVPVEQRIADFWIVSASPSPRARTYLHRA